MQDRLLFPRISNSSKSILLLGPRQVGKSTLIKALRPQKLINLADEQNLLLYSKDPGLLKKELTALKSPSLIALDEVQRVPKLLNDVQAICDDFEIKHRFLLTGSSARKLRHGGANLLPGRIIQEFMDPLSYLEIKNDFDLERCLQIGMLPGIYFDRNEGQEVLETYVEVYLREEIRAEGLARDIGAYARFLDVVAMISGQWLNYSKLSSDTEIAKETIRRYLSVLEDTLLIFRVPSFQPVSNISRRVSQRDKIFLFDVGVRNAILGLHKGKLSKDQVGPIFEQWVVLQVIYLNRALRKGWKIFSYLSAGGAEVDCVIQTQAEIYGIEIKSGRNVTWRQSKGLNSLAEIVGKKWPYRKIIVYTGQIVQKLQDGTEILPVETFLERLSQT